MTAEENARVELPKGDVSATISVNLSGCPGHGFDGAVEPVVDPPALFELPQAAIMPQKTRVGTRGMPSS